MRLFFRKNLGWLMIIVLCALPVIRWLFLLPLSSRLIGFNAIMTSLGQLSGLVGLTLFSINLIISSRLKILDALFYGLNNVYGYHRIAGALAFSLLLFHPLFLSLRLVEISLRKAALFLLPSAEWPLMFGRVGLFLMATLLIITFYIRLKYERWKISHKFMVAAFVFACLHASLISSDLSRDPILRGYILGLAGLGLSLGFYHSFLSGNFNRDYKYKVHRLIKLNQQVIEIELAPVGRQLNFTAGQFAFLRFPGGRVSPESHPFSMASAPEEKNLKFVIKFLGDYTGSLENLQAGDDAYLKGPFGRFSYKLLGRRQVWLAGGIGLTPFLSMARQLADDDSEIELYYSVKNSTEAVFLDEFLRLNSARRNFKVNAWFSDDLGRLTAEKIKAAGGDFLEKDFLICGPKPFMRSLKQQLIDLGVRQNNIHWEKFDLI